MALPMILPALATAVGGGSALATVASGAMGAFGAMSANKNNKKAIDARNAANRAAYGEAKAAELEAQRINDEGVQTGLNRPFERNIMTGTAQRAYLGGLNPAARDLANQIMAKQAEFDRIEGDEGGEKTRALQEEIQSLVAQKDSLEFQSLTDAGSGYEWMRDRADAAAGGIYSEGPDNLLNRQIDSYGDVWGQRAGLDPFRQESLTGIEAAEQGMTDPNRFAAMQAMAIERAQATDDPITQQLRLDATDTDYLADIQNFRRQRAENIVANANFASNELTNRLGARRAYGGSSTATNRGNADIMLSALQAASNARLGADEENAAQLEDWRQMNIQAQVMNQADNKAFQQNMIGARMGNEDQMISAQREQDASGLDALNRRLQAGLQGRNELMQNADDKRMLQMKGMDLELSSINLPGQLAGLRQADLMRSEQALAGLNQLRYGSMAPTHIGRGNMTAVTPPVMETAGPKQSVLGGIFKSVMPMVTGNMASNKAFGQKKDLLKMQLDRKYGGGGDGRSGNYVFGDNIGDYS